MNNAYLSLGSNEGDRLLWMQKAAALLGKYGSVVKKSSVYETAAWGITVQADFLNMVICLQTNLAPIDLLAIILKIETNLGRHQNIKWGPWIIDIDILLYNELVLNLPGLIIPHPFLHQRRFTLVPLAEIAPDILHPLLNKTVLVLLNECTDKLEVHKYKYQN